MLCPALAWLLVLRERVVESTYCKGSLTFKTKKNELRRPCQTADIEMNIKNLLPVCDLQSTLTNSLTTKTYGSFFPLSPAMLPIYIYCKENNYFFMKDCRCIGIKFDIQITNIFKTDSSNIDLKISFCFLSVLLSNI